MRRREGGTSLRLRWDETEGKERRDQAEGGMRPRGRWDEIKGKSGRARVEGRTRLMVDRTKPRRSWSRLRGWREETEEKER